MAMEKLTSPPTRAALRATTTRSPPTSRLRLLHPRRPRPRRPLLPHLCPHPVPCLHRLRKRSRLATTGSTTTATERSTLQIRAASTPAASPSLPIPPSRPSAPTVSTTMETGELTASIPDAASAAAPASLPIRRNHPLRRSQAPPRHRHRSRPQGLFGNGSSELQRPEQLPA
jgi:hypothetical protein